MMLCGTVAEMQEATSEFYLSRGDTQFSFAKKQQDTVQKVEREDMQLLEETPRLSKVRSWSHISARAAAVVVVVTMFNLKPVLIEPDA
jgi:hypothetical protein